MQLGGTLSQSWIKAGHLVEQITLGGTKSLVSFFICSQVMWTGRHKIWFGKDDIVESIRKSSCLPLLVLVSLETRGGSLIIPNPEFFWRKQVSASITQLDNWHWCFIIALCRSCIGSIMLIWQRWHCRKDERVKPASHSWTKSLGQLLSSKRFCFATSSPGGTLPFSILNSWEEHQSLIQWNHCHCR